MACLDFHKLVLKVLWFLTVLVMEGVSKLSIPCPEMDMDVLVPNAGACTYTGKERGRWLHKLL